MAISAGAALAPLGDFGLCKAAGGGIGASKAARAGARSFSLPSQQCSCGFHCISPTVLGLNSPLKLMRLGFRGGPLPRFFEWCTVGAARALLELIGFGCTFRLVLMEDSGPPSRTVGSDGVLCRVALTEPIRCSRARREALVSRAKRGTGSCLGGLRGVDGVGGGGSSLTDVVEVLCDWRPSLLRIWTDFGAPRAIGCFMNLDSVEAEVGRSSKASSSLPSPNALRRVGLVRVRLDAASRVSDSGAWRPVGVVGRWFTLVSREIGRLTGTFSFESEDPGRKFREDLILMW